MNYKFINIEIANFPNNANDIIEGRNYYLETISLKMINENYKILESLGRLSGEYVKKIVSKMDDVKNGKLDIYGFGPEDSVYIEAAGPTFHREEFRNKCYITKAFDREFSLIVEFDEIYNLMKDFLVEIEKWEKKTGKEKPGW